MSGNVRVTNTSEQAVPTGGAVHHQVTVSNTAGSLETLGSFSWSANTSHVWWQVEDANVRATFDGSTTPVSSGAGMLLSSGYSGYWSKIMADKAVVVRDASTDAVLQLVELNWQ